MKFVRIMWVSSSVRSMPQNLTYPGITEGTTMSRGRKKAASLFSLLY